MEKIHLTKYGITGLLTVILISILLVSFVSAISLKQIYNPFTRQLDYYHDSNFTGENITAYNITAFFLDGNLSWDNLYNYPVACPNGSAITLLGDIVTCTDSWVNVVGDTMTGNLIMNESQIGIGTNNPSTDLEVNVSAGVNAITTRGSAPGIVVAIERDVGVGAASNVFLQTFQNISGGSVFNGLQMGILTGVTASQITYAWLGTATTTDYQTAQNVRFYPDLHTEFDGDIDINNNLITEIHALDFNLTSNASHQEGRLHWNDVDKTLDIDTHISGVSLQSGQEMYIFATNKLGFTINNSQLVYINGAQGNRPTVALAKADSEATSMGTIAMATHDCSDSTNCFFTTIGLVRDVNTSAYDPGQLLFLSSDVAGGYTNVTIISPNHSVSIGYVVRQSSSEGVILLRIINGDTLDDLHDVHYPTTPSNGTLLVWNIDNLRWENGNTIDSLEVSKNLTATGMKTETFILSDGASNMSLTIIGKETTLTTDNGNFIYDLKDGKSVLYQYHATTQGDGRYNSASYDPRTVAKGIGGGFGLGGTYLNANTMQTVWAAIWSAKENAVDGEYGGELHMGARPQGGLISSDLILYNDGNMNLTRGNFTASFLEGDGSLLINLQNNSNTTEYWITPDGILDGTKEITTMGNYTSEHMTIVNGWLNIGNGTPLVNTPMLDNDLYVEGRSELLGRTVFRGTTLIYNTLNAIDHRTISVGSLGDDQWAWSRYNTVHSAVRMIDTANGGSWIYGDKASVWKNFGHPFQPHPTIYLQSAEDPEVNGTQWASLQHNGFDFVIEAGAGDVFINNTMRINDGLTITNGSVDFTWKQLTPHSLIDGGVLGLMATNPPNDEAPHFWISTGGPGQASGIARSFMIVNENTTLLNSTDRSSCQAWANEFNKTLKIDCNTTTTGADLLVGDDMQVFGDLETNVHYAEGSYHNETVPVTIGIASIDTWYNMTNFTQAHTNEVTFAGDGININKTDTYLISASFTVSGGNAGKYRISLFVNDVENMLCGAGRDTTSTDWGNLGITCLDDFTAGDSLVFKVKDVQAPAQDLNIYFQTANIIEIN